MRKVLLLLLLVFAAVVQPASPANGKNKAADTIGVTGKFDYYKLGGNKIMIYRSAQEISVKFKAGTPESKKSEVMGKAKLGKGFTKLKVINKTRGIDVYESMEIKSKEAHDSVMEKLKAEADVEFAYSVLLNMVSGLRQVMTDEITAKAGPGVSESQMQTLAASLGLEVVGKLERLTDVYVLRLLDPKSDDPLDVANALCESGLVAWAVPNFIDEISKNAVIPNDTRFNEQWSLNNTGQGGGTVDADVDAPEAWEKANGNNVLIAVIDDGVDMVHEDLSANVTWAGWDFHDDDGDPSPSHADDNHGTAVAGVAAAAFNNSMGVAGVAPAAIIVPIKISEGPSVVDNAKKAQAITYAADNANVINISWTYSPDPVIDEALNYAVRTKGVPVFCSSGNGASYLKYTIANLAAGDYSFNWYYIKDGSMAAGDDTVWIDDVRWANGDFEDFEGGFTGGWWGSTSSNGVGWSVAAEDGTDAARPDALADSQWTCLSRAVAGLPAGEFSFWYKVDTEKSCDRLQFQVDGDIKLVASGPGIGYPASSPLTIAVGSTVNSDTRAASSQYGAALDFVAPGASVLTTDRMDTAGYNTDAGGNYATVSGTSFASPLAAGTAALLLSLRQNLNPEQVRYMMRSTCDKVGPLGYSNGGTGRNDEYGYGRINADALLSAKRKGVCGDCHGIPPVDTDNCDGDARGLHGVHFNYASFTYLSDMAENGKCSYCHPPTPDTSPTAIHNNDITDYASTMAPSLSYDGSSCTNACHANRGETAPWGSYTSASVRLSCRSCHDDITDAAATNLSGRHREHLLTNISTPDGPMGAPGNTGCRSCHPDNAADLWSGGRRDDGTVKAYPHASDGTFVNQEKAEIKGGIGFARAAASTDTCTDACHKNEPVQWDGALSCTSCHYYSMGPMLMYNESSIVKLGGSHSGHFKDGLRGIVCADCHVEPPVDDTAHVSALPVVSDNAAVLANLSALRMPGSADTCLNACHRNEPAVWGGALTCNSCHYYSMGPTALNNDLARVSLSGSHSAHFGDGGTMVCTNCHVEPPTNDTGHMTSLPPVADNAYVNLTGGVRGTYDGLTHSCTGTGAGCHGATSTPGWGTASSGCATCHSYPATANEWPDGNGHMSRYDGTSNRHLPATGWDGWTDTYDSTAGDLTKCGLCHYSTQPSEHRDGVITLNPQGYSECGLPSFTIITSTGPNATCNDVSCHNGVPTQNWW